MGMRMPCRGRLRGPSEDTPVERFPGRLPERAGPLASGLVQRPEAWSYGQVPAVGLLQATPARGPNAQQGFGALHQRIGRKRFCGAFPRSDCRSAQARGQRVLRWRYAANPAAAAWAGAVMRLPGAGRRGRICCGANPSSPRASSGIGWACP
jgi:hypothetical protein